MNAKIDSVGVSLELAVVTPSIPRGQWTTKVMLRVVRKEKLRIIKAGFWRSEAKGQDVALDLYEGETIELL